jgi:hypothetical protein
MSAVCGQKTIDCIRLRSAEVWFVTSQTPANFGETSPFGLGIFMFFYNRMLWDDPPPRPRRFGGQAA